MTCFDDLNPKFSMILATSIFMRSLNSILSRVDHEKSFVNFGSGRHVVS